MKYKSVIQGIPKKLIKALRLVVHLVGWRSLDERLSGWVTMGYWPHVKHPRSFNEHLQHRKLFDRNPLFPSLADKVQVRKFVEERLGPGYLIPSVAVYEKPEDIDWEALPSSFVLKTNHRSGGNILVRDKAKLDLAQAKASVRRWFDEPYGQEKYEWFYSGFPRRILIEEFLRDPVTEVPADLKFYVFHGKVQFTHIDQGRFGDHTRAYFDRDWNWQPFTTYVSIGEALARPENLDELYRVAEALGAGFDFMRVDLYSIGSRIYFGEMTMTPMSGRGAFHPDKKFDFLLGQFWKKP